MLYAHAKNQQLQCTLNLSRAEKHSCAKTISVKLTAAVAVQALKLQGLCLTWYVTKTLCAGDLVSWIMHIPIVGGGQKQLDTGQA